MDFAKHRVLKKHCHVLQEITALDYNSFKNVSIEYKAKYFYCEQVDETFEDEQLISLNEIAIRSHTSIFSIFP